jgi:AraC-like DNA-binding protein
MLLSLRTVFSSELLTVRHAIARPSPQPRKEAEPGISDVLLLPVAGMFAKHEGPDRHFIANPNHALFFRRGKPYRITFPDGEGDESLVVEFSKPALAGLLAETIGVADFHTPVLETHCLLPSATVLARESLWRVLSQGSPARLAVEELCVGMLSASLQAACKDMRRADRARHAFTMARRRRQVETVKELISLQPAADWSLDALARQANTSPYHLARVFREEVGAPVHQYLVRTRISKALEAMRRPGTSLTDIAVDTGFAHHSHFTASFRSFFGMTPTQLQRSMGTAAD